MLVDGLEVNENLAAARAVRLLADDAHLLLLRVGHHAADHRDGARDGQMVVPEDDGAGAQDVADDVRLLGLGQRDDVAGL
jgi:hypothetical protein